MKDEIDFRQICHALSDTLDLVGVDELQHGKRVAFMVMECGRALGLTRGQLDRLYHAALLHDCGVSSTAVHRALVGELDWSGSEEHCRRGFTLLASHELFADLAPLIRPPPLPLVRARPPGVGAGDGHDQQPHLPLRPGGRLGGPARPGRPASQQPGDPRHHPHPSLHIF